MGTGMHAGASFNLSLLAHSHAPAGQVDEACSVGQSAVDATRDHRSDRARSYLGGLSQSLTPADGLSNVRDLRQEIATLQAA
jgi:hypothetical protein